MANKERKVFSINNFRGLDKENKLLKVADFRASDGKNFIIDSETLKTRPAITHKDTLPFDIEVDDKLVASYKFREVEIFITKFHIYIYDGKTVMNEKHSNVLKQAISSLNFEGKEPLFREEKDCLFIFNVGDIYVFSILRDSNGKIYKYVLYPLSATPLTNPFLAKDYYYDKFEDLPKPYEPTIFIGDNRYEDINLLSKVTKYKLFASNRDAKDGKTTYILPTVYEKEKHFDYSFDISFYQNKFAEHGIYPIFLGRKGEDIDEDIDEIEINYGATLNKDDGIEVEDVFFPKEDFVFTVDPENITTLANPTKVSDIVGVTKEWFFKAKVREDNKQVFTYILEYINIDQSLAEPLIDGNKTLKFSLPIKYNAVYKDSSKDNTVVARKVEEMNVDIYVQLKFYAFDQTLFTNKTVYSSPKVTEYDLYNEYPEYPNVDVEEPFTEIELPPISSPSLTKETFENVASSYLRLHKGEYDDEEKLKIKGRLFNGSSKVQKKGVTVNGKESWIYRDIATITNKKTRVSELRKVYNPNNNNDFPNYPYVTGTFTEKNLFESPQQIANFSQGDFESLCEDYILEHESDFEDGEKVKLLAQFKDYYNEVTPESITPEAYTLWKYATLPEMVRNTEYVSSKTNVLPNNPDYPEYPTGGSSGHIVIDLPKKLQTGYTQSHFVADCKAYINENPADFKDGDLVKFRGRYYEESTIETAEVVNAEASSNWIFSERNELLNKFIHDAKVNRVDPSDAFPAYPNVSTSGRTVIDLGLTEFSSFTDANGINEVVKEVNNYFDNNFDDFSDNELLYFKKRLYQRHPWSTTNLATVNPYYNEWEISEEDHSIIWNNIDSFNIDYPYYPRSYDEEVYVGLLSQTGQNFNYSSTTLLNEIKATIMAKISSFQGSSGNGVAYVKLQTRWDDGQGTFYYKGVALAVPFSWTKGVDEGYVETRGSYVVTAEVQKGIYDKTITFGQVATFPTAPSIANPNGYPVIDLGISHTVVGTSVNFSSPAIKNAIEAGISAKLSQLTADSGHVYAIARVQLDHTSGSAYDKGWTFAVLVDYAKQGTVASELRQSMISLVEIQRNIYDKEDITINAPETFPAYPTFSNPNGYQVLDYGIVHTDTVENVDFSNPTLLSNLENAISTNIENITANSGYIFAKFKVQTSYNGGANVKGYSIVAKVQFEKYSNSPYENRQSMIMTLDIDRAIHIKEIEIGDPSTYPLYPTFDNPNGYEVYDFGIVYTGTGQTIDFNSIDLLRAIESEILKNVDTFDNNSGNAFARIKVQNSYNNVNTGASLVVGFYYQKYVSTPYQDRQSFVMTTVVDKNQQMAEEGVYEYTFDDKEKAFVVKVRDYFFDYNDEPSIEVKITFNKNPDYKMISDCKFGTTFGSENRLFLAGNLNYPNIDRFNVSNDLLGDNIRNQSYELTYFPSKNYRVIGGRGAINGYVVATDSHLYVTKENYPNDEKLFIRERILDENGVVGYHEYKTSVKKSPLNNKCIVRFYNDILILSEDGLHGIEISSNVLTDERLIKPRDGFIKRDLVNAIKNYDHSKIFMVENDVYLYIFIGDDIYVADSRYLAKNEDGEVGNFSYEIVKWKAPTTYLNAKIEEQNLELIQHDGKALYHLENGKDYDDLVERHNNFLSLYPVQGMDKNAFLLPTTHMYIKDNPQDYVFKLKQGFKVIGVEGLDYHINNGMVVVDNSLAFRNISDGQKVYFKVNEEYDGENDFVSIEVLGYNEDGLGFPYNTQLDLDLSKIYMNIAELPLKVSLIFEFDNTTYFRLTPFTPSEVPFIKQENNETTLNYLERLDTYLVDNQDYIFRTDGLQDCYINKPSLIQTRWVSGITDLRSKLMEKTMFRANVYATRQSKGSSLVFGYKTMRKGDYLMKDTLDVSNQNNLEALNFNHFGFNTFSEMGASFPLKENNFLYIQFEMVGTGQIELNSIEIIYKLNRRLKSIG